MTTETFVIYLDWLMDFYKGKKIGLIIDYAPSHDNVTLTKWVQKLTECKRDTQTVLIVEWIDKCLTSVYQPGDIAINKPLKDFVKKCYSNHIVQSLPSYKPGMRLKVTREQLLTFIESSVESINAQQKKTLGIYKSFTICGLNSWVESLDDFHNHLDSLSNNALYKTLLRTQQALDIKL